MTLTNKIEYNLTFAIAVLLCDNVKGNTGDRFLMPLAEDGIGEIVLAQFVWL